MDKKEKKETNKAKKDTKKAKKKAKEDLERGEALSLLQGHGAAVQGVVFSSSGQTACSASSDGSTATPHSCGVTISTVISRRSA